MLTTEYLFVSPGISRQNTRQRVFSSIVRLVSPACIVLKPNTLVASEIEPLLG